MASIQKDLTLEASAEHVWDAVRDIGAVHTRLAREFVIATKVEDGSRLVTFANGITVRELIVDVDDRLRRMAYSVVEWQTRHHNASFQVFAVSATRCRLVWITDFLPDDLAGLLQGLIDQGSAAIKKTLES